MSESSLPVVHQLRQARRYLTYVGVQSRFVILSAAFCAVGALLNFYIVLLVFPVIHGILSWNTDQLLDMKLVGWLIRTYPNLFHSNGLRFVLLISWLYLIILVRTSMEFCGTLLIRREAMKASLGMRGILVNSFLNFGKAFYDENPTGRLAGETLRFTDWIEKLLTTIHNAISDLLKLFAYAAVMLWLSWQLLVAAMLMVPIVQAISARITKKVGALSLSLQAASSRSSQSLHEILANHNLIRVFDTGSREKSHFLADSAAEMGVSYKLLGLRALVEPILNLGATTGQFFMALVLSKIYVPSAAGTSEAVMAYFIVSRIMPLFSSIQRAIITFNVDAGVSASYEKLMNYDDKHVIPDGTLPFPASFDEIRFDHVCFSYDGSRKILNDISLTLPRGQLTVLIGPTGSGKSTLANLLIRNYELSQGTIRIGGVDLRDIEGASLKSNLSLVDQESSVLRATLRENILYGCKEVVSDQRIFEVLEQTCLASLVEKLPKGLDTELGDRGARFSGGERQRIAIARAIIRNPKILILDEPTSALDQETENIIIDNLLRHRSDLTVFMITHGTTVLSIADQIIKLTNGELELNSSVKSKPELVPV